uniref:Putative secreted protein n=1 Tax=Phlebotomus kandelakii TaxID=1109342 RepID=A0A6B2ECW6_9DIPT
MNFVSFLGISINLSIVTICVYCEHTVKNCSTSDLDSDCPINSRCLQTLVDSTSGKCECSETDNYQFNAMYENEADYCVRRHTETAKADTVQVVLRRPPSSHHIVGGILIPIFVVLIIVGVVYGTVRYRVAQRIREAVVSRFFVRHRPSYQDVMMGTDFDDPPLI